VFTLIPYGRISGRARSSDKAQQLSPRSSDSTRTGPGPGSCVLIPFARIAPLARGAPYAACLTPPRATPLRLSRSGWPSEAREDTRPRDEA